MNGTVVNQKNASDSRSKHHLYLRYKTLSAGLNQESTIVSTEVVLPRIEGKSSILDRGATYVVSGAALNFTTAKLPLFSQAISLRRNAETDANRNKARANAELKSRPVTDDRIVKLLREAENSANRSTENNAKQDSPNRKSKTILAESALPNEKSEPNQASIGERSTISPIKEVPESLPLRPHDAISIFGDRLTNFEKDEIHTYEKIWFVGEKNIKKIDATSGKPNNSGFDDDHAFYNLVLHDHLAYRFEIVESLGRGSFGQVVKAIDHETGTTVAVKLIRNKKRLRAQAEVEVKNLRNLKIKDPTGSNGFVIIKENFQFRNHSCIVFELLSSNLYELMRHNRFIGLGIGLIRQIAAGLLRCLRFLHSERIIHCDLKPENIMFNASDKCILKVIDFGSSCYETQLVYSYIQSRFYRAPEVILGIAYTTKIDMWSFGCILGELFNGTPLFCGENESEQLALIMEICGKPPKSMLEVASRKAHFFDSKGETRSMVDSNGQLRLPGSRALSSLIPTSDYSFLDFVGKCLVIDPAKRMSPEEAFNHPWIQILFRNLKQTRRIKRDRVDKKY